MQRLFSCWGSRSSFPTVCFLSEWKFIYAKERMNPCSPILSSHASVFPWTQGYDPGTTTQWESPNFLFLHTKGHKSQRFKVNPLTLLQLPDQKLRHPLIGSSDQGITSWNQASASCVSSWWVWGKNSLPVCLGCQMRSVLCDCGTDIALVYLSVCWGLLSAPPGLWLLATYMPSLSHRGDPPDTETLFHAFPQGKFCPS